MLPEILKKDNLSIPDIYFLLSLEKEDDITLLFNEADKIRKEYRGDEIFITGLIEFSNYCEKDCSFCGLQSSNNKVERYRMNADEIIDTAQRISRLGIRSIALQSGSDFIYDKDIIAYIIYSIKQSTDVEITLCIGEREIEEYKAWKMAGADRYLLRYETSDEEKYKKMHQNGSFMKRITTLHELVQMGYKIQTGNIIGLPNQTLLDLAKDIYFAYSFNLESVIIGPITPMPWHHFSPNFPITAEITAKSIAIMRFMFRDKNITSSSALDLLKMNGRKIGLMSGANALFTAFLPNNYQREDRIEIIARGCFDPDISIDEFKSKYKVLSNI